MPVLLLKTSDGKTREMPVGARLVIGRGTSCDLPIEDERASRRHAEIYRQGTDFFLKDMGSKNGTRLNGRPVALGLLAFGDEITVGHTRMVFADHAPSELVGTVVAGYQVLEQIASGGMGVVYRARQLTLDRIVALKVLHPRLGASRSFVERFLREAHAAGSLSHVHIVHVHDVGHVDDTYYYAMEFVDGPNVAEVLRTGGRLAPDRAVEIALQIASALSYAHQHGVVHRDIKPENIMLAADGTAKLADLGLAKLAEADPSDLERGPDGKPRVWGTPSYMAPEVAMGQEADRRSDLYSLGATLFHMLTGRTPFPGASATDILTKHVGAPVPELQALVPRLPTALNPVVERLMAKRREARYQTADELIADLTVLREVVRQSVGAEETRAVTPLRPAEPAAKRSSVLRLLRKWLGLRS